MTLDRTITTWHGSYRFYSGDQTPSDTSDGSLFFLLASLRRRDRDLLNALARDSHGLLSQPLPQFNQVSELSDALLEAAAFDLEWRVASGQLRIEKIDPLKGIHIRDVPPPQPEILPELPEEVIAAALVDEPIPPATTWYEVVVIDENEVPINNAKIIFTIGSESSIVPTDSEGKARIDNVDEQRQVTAKIELPDDSATESGR